MDVKLPSEHVEQVRLVSWFRKEYPGVLIFAIPNGGSRHKATAVNLKTEGVVSGIPDLFIPEWSLWIEMKRQKGGRLSPAQKKQIEYLISECGHFVITGYGFNDAADKVLSHLEDIHIRLISDERT